MKYLRINSSVNFALTTSSHLTGFQFNGLCSKKEVLIIVVNARFNAELVSSSSNASKNIKSFSFNHLNQI